MVHVAQVFLGHLRHVGAAPYLHRHQSLGSKHLQRFAQQRAADAELLGDLQFVDPTARLQLAAENALAQLFRHLFVERARGVRVTDDYGGTVVQN